MYNEFLTTMLQVVIALNVAGLIAYFCLGTVRRQPAPRLATVPTSSAWNKLTAPCRSIMHRLRPATANGAVDRYNSHDTIEAALGRLHRVLDGYRNSLS